MKSKKKSIIIVIAVIIVVLVTAITIIISNSDKYIRFMEFDISDCINKECDKLFEFNKNTISIKNDKENNYTININNEEKFIGSKGFPKLGNTIYTFDDIVMFEQSLSEYIKNFMILPLSGEGIIISTLDENNNISLNSFKIKDILNEEGKVEGKEIIINGSNFEDENSFRYGYAPDNLAKLDSCESYENNKDRIVAGVYSMKYLGNNKFDEIKMISEIALKDYKIKDFSTLCDNK